ncbi:MAG TPA: ribosomal protein S18-alanine N-acetyltransferase [Pyrinomonadaceae bacterium]|jgi:ribosomal-protein-alanine N-acetyltransferase
MKDINFRKMIFGDIPAVLEIEKECFLSPWSFEGYRDELLRDDSAIFIAENKGEIIGFAATRLITSANEGEILNIAVRRQFQNQGIGTLLLKAIIDFFKTNKIQSIWLEVRKSNFTAREFYRRNGFTSCGERKNFYTSPTEDALLMKLNL